jgi:proteasome lid subunit RPN8/RPN11
MVVTTSKLKRKLRVHDTTERCGLVLTDGTLVEIENAHPEPEKGYRIPIVAIQDYYETLAGTWHTHPYEDALMSQDDYLGFSQWPGLHHYIIGKDGVRCFVADEKGLVREAD